ncbi:uncharacterized protein LOC127256593 isoform X2 [Andrographis paniculata]|uniref:uncharacterized protein LOC127256593 isoform X2 n=1 Tax=Andrographis paniculata TaxID=175694 RepID=UPI0021E8169C|nr:uncharacterized protein LOC127256593 isoform X2 [Andrographis paniculata]XP_051138647.1 uncharacterized protein LOC127256593 isoform X2 [Andrographis paniculata]
MDTNAQESPDAKAEFRKPSTDASNRKYRRRSSVGRSSSSSDGSPGRDRSRSPLSSRKDDSKIGDDKHKKDSSRSSGRSGESYRHSDRQSSRSHHRHDQGYSKSSYRSGRDSRDYSKGDLEHRSRDYANDGDAYYRTKSEGSGHKSRDKDSYERTGSGKKNANIDDRDKGREKHRDDRGDRYGKTDHRKSSGDHKRDRGGRNNSSLRDTSGNHSKEAFTRDSKELDCEGGVNDEKKTFRNQGIHDDQDNRQLKEHSVASSIKDEDFVAKKSKFSSIDSMGPATDGTSEQAFVTDSDIDAARIAAMKAAELVNKNLVGTGYMSTDQKKKLLWGSKKTAATEESAHRWDTTTFGDRERQEKFNKLMGVKGDAKVELKSDNPDVEKQREQLQMELEKQYTAGLRRRDGRTVGLGL